MPAPASSQPVSPDSQRPAEPQPAILLVSALHEDVLARQFRRYVHEYDVRAVDSQASLSAALEQLEELSAPVALFVLDTSPETEDQS